MRLPSPKIEDQEFEKFVTPEPPTQPAPPTPAWQRIDERPLVQKVKIVEAACDAGIAALRDIMQIMAQHVDSDAAVKFELSSLKKVMEQKKEHPIYIGFLGASGDGKSSKRPGAG
ncbi:4fe02b83-e15d-404c-94d6-78e4e43a8e7f [Sclerotinia trifoliorum]|uniref:4fe02b83-e15d-404c-94d6-78e4e43a8e7f n=1 Tax=Sclerotinia trifoliorum TaxID=28548 RepID=A0A8H2ZN82_9HELO|nr:4fe02b83-e15d-404c-94d6-78e4e43a8e7f [Sclerotinia trifoliorum]